MEVTVYQRVGSLLLSLFLLAGFVLTVTTKVAHAYIDIGSGSIILQGLLAGVFGSLFALKIWWRRFTGLLSRFFSKVKSPKETIE